MVRIQLSVEVLDGNGDYVKDVAFVIYHFKVRRYQLIVKSVPVSFHIFVILLKSRSSVLTKFLTVMTQVSSFVCYLKNS